jgi:hypothetical protein
VTVFLSNHPSYTKPLKYQLLHSPKKLWGCEPDLNHFEDFTMSAPTNASTNPSPAEQDAVEAIVPLMPIVLPLVGAVTMLLIAFIAVFMA